MKIKALTLYTQDLKGQKEFYTRTLSLPLYSENENSFELKTGSSVLRFVSTNEYNNYHFAITIPSNKEEEAHQWLKNRVELLKYDDDEMIDFVGWNAKAMYFYDNDKNIVEFIARKNLKINTVENFSENSLIEISEIGVPTDNIAQLYQYLTNNYSLKIFDGNLEKFCAIGNERGLFIIIDKNKKNWFPTNDKSLTSDFVVKIEINSVEKEIEFVNGKFNEHKLN